MAGKILEEIAAEGGAVLADDLVGLDGALPNAADDGDLVAGPDPFGEEAVAGDRDLHFPIVDTAGEFRKRFIWRAVGVIV